MNNEPIAWMIIDVENGKSLQFKENKFSEINIPLYTHPHSEESVKAKTLTDEEIYEIAMEVQTGFLPQDDTLAFARAILRKAQEK